MNYTIKIPFTTIVTVSIDADNAKEAIEKALEEAKNYEKLQYEAIDSEVVQEVLDSMEVYGDLDVTNEDTGGNAYVDPKLLGEVDLQEIDEVEEFELMDESCTHDAVVHAFPGMDEKAVEILTNWYYAEGASEDFDTVDEFAEFIRGDIFNMLDAATNQEEIETVVKAMRKLGYEMDDIEFLF